MMLLKSVICVMGVFVMFFSVNGYSADDVIVLDSRPGYRLVSKNNDLFIETEDGSQSSQVTNTPQIGEIAASFTPEGGYIRYLDENYEAHIVEYRKPDEAIDNLAIQEQITYNN